MKVFFKLSVAESCISMYGLELSNWSRAIELCLSSMRLKKESITGLALLSILFSTDFELHAVLNKRNKNNIFFIINY
jgi:hypothetical protein